MEYMNIPSGSFTRIDTLRECQIIILFQELFQYLSVSEIDKKVEIRSVFTADERQFRLGNIEIKPERI